ncbi:MAG TPA: hypothetical protein VHJ17_02660 [Thermomonospora sp.]|nr:hypothetical protein [Thermomonospora sp.]
MPERVVRAILRMTAERRLVNRTRGWHECFLCPAGPYPIRMDFEGTELALGDAEIRVVGPDGTVYAAPNLVAHYIGAHSYRPPQGFIDAFPGCV